MEVLPIQGRKVHMISLVCARNRVDSEVMLGSLLKQDWAITDVAEEADAVIINTCGFIEAAKEESVQTILEAAELKKNNPELKLVVAGCLTQRYKKQLVTGLPEVDLFIGTDEFPAIANAARDQGPQGRLIPLARVPARNSTARLSVRT